MAVHRKAAPLMEPMEAMARLAARAQSRAEAAQTRASGSASYDNGDGTRTVIGPQTGSATMATHVGDVTPPPVPRGISAWSGDGSIHVSWDGTLAGEMPADFDHVTVLVDGSPVAEMRSAGSTTVDGLAVGSTVPVTATAEDDCCLADGTPAHNVSAACAAVEVEVTDQAAEVSAGLRVANDSIVAEVAARTRTDASVAELSTRVTQTEGELTVTRRSYDSRLGTIEAGVRVSGDTVELGRSDSAMRQVLTSSRTSFVSGSTEVMSLDGATATVSAAQLRLGAYTWMPTNGGANLSLVYTG